jgi:hypothetical protein
MNVISQGVTERKLWRWYPFLANLRVGSAFILSTTIALNISSPNPAGPMLSSKADYESKEAFVVVHAASRLEFDFTI